MSTLPGTSCLLTEVGDPPLFTRTTRPPRGPIAAADPGEDDTRQAHATTVGRLAVQCSVCRAPLGASFTRRAASGKVFCQVCADRAVAAYYARHPEARPAAPRLARERTGTSYLAERERYAVRYHAGNARWQISDTQARRWTSQRHATEDAATTAAAAMNAAWREQIAHERRTLGSHILPSTSPRHTWRVGERAYGREE